MTFEALDVLAATNPALGSLIIYFFVESFIRAAETGPDLALAYLPVPVALSAPLARTFEGTTVATGLLGWTARDPSALLYLPEQTEAAVTMSRSSIIFGLQHGILAVVDGRLVARPEALRRVPKDPTGVDITRRPFTVAARLGTWCGAMRSSAMVFITLGIKV